jgi:hypothetical protein
MAGKRWARRGLGAAIAAVLLLASAGPAAADRYDSDRAGHPLRILAYLAHPLGVAVDYIVLRPVHWIGTHEPFATIFGHDDY